VRFRLPQRLHCTLAGAGAAGYRRSGLDSDTIWIGCEKSARKNTVVRSCVCALSWEALAYLALNKKIVLDLTPCGQCENDLCAEQLQRADKTCGLFRSADVRSAVLAGV